MNHRQPFCLSKNACFVADFNVQIIKVAVLQQTQDWGVPQIQNIRLIILEHFLLTIAFYCPWYSQQLFCNGYTLHVYSVPWHIQNKI